MDRPGIPRLDGCRASVRLVVFAVISLGFMARAATYRSPLFDFHSWRQADTASISRNFLEERFNPLYPQVDWRGAQPHGYVASGLELHAFLVALVSRAVGFSPSVGRLLNACLFPLAALLLFRFTRRRYGDATGVAAVIIYSLGLPLTIFIDRAFMNESLLALLAIASLWAAQSYCATRRGGTLAVLVGAMALIAMVKPTYLVIAAPVAGLFFERDGARAWLRWELWLVAAAAALCGGLWFAHAKQLAASSGLTFGIGDKLFDPDVLFSREYPVKIAVRLVKDILGPVGVVFAPIGAVLAARSGKYAEALGLLMFAVYLVVVTIGNFHHNYYQLPVVSVAAVLAAVGVVGVVSRMADRNHWARARTLKVGAAVLSFAAFAALARSVSAHNWYEIDRSRQRLCEEVRPHLQPADRVVFVNEGSPDVLFCLDRKGWLLTARESTVERLRLLPAEGATVFIFRSDDPALRPLEARWPRIAETPGYAVLRAVRR